MSERTCPVCNVEIPKEAHGRQIYCSQECGRWAGRNLNTKTCKRPGCSGVRRARGLCGTHYNQEHQPARHQKRPVPCSWCGAIVEKYPSGKRRPVCSTECRRKLTFGDKPPRPKKPKRSKELIGPVVFEKSCVPPVTVVKSAAHLTWVAGKCQWCGISFVKATPNMQIPRSCSDRCTNKLIKARHETAKGRFQIAPVRRLRLYERDNWTCQLCFEPIDRDAHYLDDWAPSLDHIIPQSHTLAPDHSDANLRTAHRWCNAVRGDESHYTAADLVA